MAGDVLIGNDYLIWVGAEAAEPAALELLGGQQSATLNLSMSTGDASHKTSGGFGLKIPGLRDAQITGDFIATLPDDGYGVVEGAVNGRVPVKVEIRGNAETGAPADAIFGAVMWITAMNVGTPQNGAVSGSFTFDLARAPYKPLTLA